jgi:hypothetical protein
LKPSTPEEIYQQAVIDWLASDAVEFKHPPECIQIAYADEQIRRRERAEAEERAWWTACRKRVAAKRRKRAAVLAELHAQRDAAIAELEWRRWLRAVSRGLEGNGGAYTGAGPPIELGGTLDAIAEELEGVPGCADALIAAAFALEDVPPWP